ncbi:MAG TPA: aldehyde dehydrogenase family protein [Planctomycetota bacterium]|jgi:aldehyde dehydrogenase (NAD+)|nr:aldehyde dehydrogenase family protein [Planctomycetota bacterium]
MASDSAPTSLVSIDPATEEPIGEVPVADEAEVASTVACARRAQPGWSARPIEERASILLRAADLLEARAETMARLVTREEGKVLAESRAETRDAAGRIRYFAEVGPRHLAPREERAERVRGIVEYAPLGVVAAIKPWNFPVQIPLWSIAPALLAGNAVVFKPSELTPIVGAALAALFHEAGVPPDVLVLLQGDEVVGRALVRAPVDMIGFVGSQAAGSSIAAVAGKDLKRVALELGGKDPMIVLADADVAAAASGAVRGAFKNCGQVCCSVERVYVERPLYRPLLDAIVDRTRALRVGPGILQGNEVGPMVSGEQRGRVLGLLEEARGGGARVLTGGRTREGKGFFIEPAVVVEAPASARLVREETFGPVLTIEPVDSAEEAVERANASSYGLTASVWSSDLERATSLARRLEAGTRAVNQTVGSLVQMPWGGRKRSGLRRMLSLEGIREFAEPVTLRLPAS